MIDQKIKNIVDKEKNKLNNELVLIASENYPSQDILDLMGSVCSVPYKQPLVRLTRQKKRYSNN